MTPRCLQATSPSSMPPFTDKPDTPTSQRLAVFQQNNSAAGKIAGIRKYGNGIELDIVAIDSVLPVVIDDAGPWLPETIQADLVLDFLRHPDVSHALAEKCRQEGIPMVASGKKGRIDGVATPPTCCALRRHESLGNYGRRFGMPEFHVVTRNGTIQQLTVHRGAPCGATWEAARRCVGLTVTEACVRIGLETQFFCAADPSGWDPISGRSPVHIAGELHKAALTRALNIKTAD